MEVATDILEFSDLKLKFDKESKQILVDVFVKDTNSFTNIPRSTCFLKIALKTSLKVLFYIFEGFAILMRNLKSTVQNIKTF